MTIAAQTKPRVLFYLPVVTPWWFTNIIVPLIRGASHGGEVHVLVPPLWSFTGIGPGELAGCLDLEDVNWHILDQADHPDLRFSAMDKPYLLELVREIDPDLCLCRSADIETPALFPGVVRYVMEGGSPPFPTSHFTVQFAMTLFDHGLMPELGRAHQAWLDAALADAWTAKKISRPQMDRADFLAQVGLPSDKLLIGLPLEYEHEEMFYDQHNIFASNAELVDALASALDDDTVLVLTQHPLNAGGHRPATELFEAIRRHGDKVRLVDQFEAAGRATTMAIEHCHGTITVNSKSFTQCAFLGRPMLRISKFATGDWMQAYSTLPPFVDALRAGTALKADEADARRWFAFHHANVVLDPYNPNLNVDDLIDLAVNRVNPARWEKGLRRFLGDDAYRLPPLPVLDSVPEWSEPLPLAVGM